MDPQSARSKAQDMRNQAQKMMQDADKLESDANEREFKVRNIRAEIADKAEQERQARNAGDEDKALELTRELRGLEAELRNEQTGSIPLL